MRENMKIMVDADACPVREIVEKIAKRLNITVFMVIDTSHIVTSDYSHIIMVSKGPDAVDFALINRTSKGDIVVTQDYGVAAMALAKGAYAIHQNGRVYTDGNIEVLLMERDIAGRCRRAGERIRGNKKKRSVALDRQFAEAFCCLCKKVIKNSPDIQ
jgi:uncharacterized protein YaiI (UPF0178 family)